MLRALLACALAGGLAACVSSSDPSLDRWHYAYETIIAPRCTTSACHSPLSQAGGIDLSDDATAYDTLTGRACGDTAHAAGAYVDTADPMASTLSGLLRRDDPTGMPPNQRLADADIQTLEDWMRGGALCD
ncbi:MAG TPA: hypothetical protein VHE35_17925 [Kofleriaceae bacterium]|nr:hypothetical protein [Kofleriaceae bacterium]